MSTDDDFGESVSGSSGSDSFGDDEDFSDGGSAASFEDSDIEGDDDGGSDDDFVAAPDSDSDSVASDALPAGVTPTGAGAVAAAADGDAEAPVASLVHVLPGHVPLPHDLRRLCCCLLPITTAISRSLRLAPADAWAVLWRPRHVRDMLQLQENGTLCSFVPV